MLKNTEDTFTEEERKIANKLLYGDSFINIPMYNIDSYRFEINTIIPTNNESDTPNNDEINRANNATDNDTISKFDTKVSALNKDDVFPFIFLYDEHYIFCTLTKTNNDNEINYFNSLTQKDKMEDGLNKLILGLVSKPHNIKEQQYMNTCAEVAAFLFCAYKDLCTQTTDSLKKYYKEDKVDLSVITDKVNSLVDKMISENKNDKVDNTANIVYDQNRAIINDILDKMAIEFNKNRMSLSLRINRLANSNDIDDEIKKSGVKNIDKLQILECMHHVIKNNSAIRDNRKNQILKSIDEIITKHNTNKKNTSKTTPPATQTTSTTAPAPATKTSEDIIKNILKGYDKNNFDEIYNKIKEQTSLGKESINSILNEILNKDNDSLEHFYNMFISLFAGLDENKNEPTNTALSQEQKLVENKLLEDKLGEMKLLSLYNAIKDMNIEKDKADINLLIDTLYVSIYNHTNNKSKKNEKINLCVEKIGLINNCLLEMKDVYNNEIIDKIESLTKLLKNNKDKTEQQNLALATL